MQNPAAKDQIIADGCYQIIARVPSGDSGLYNRRAPANARLIAAAPDSHDANVLAGGILGAILSHMEEGGQMPDLDAISAAYLAVRAAIAKARGQ
jgi:hypothetical protein